MKINLMNNLFLKLLSLGAAIVLWAVVLFVSDGEGYEYFNQEVILQNTEMIADDGKILRLEEGTDKVRITVHARKSVLAELKDSDFILTADVEKNLTHQNLVAIDVECKNKDIVVDRDVKLSRNNVVVIIEDTMTEGFAINASHVGKPNEGLIFGSLEPERTLVNITGPASIVKKIMNVSAVVDITGLSASSTKNCKLILTDGNGDQIDTTYLSYAGKESGVNVKVTMNRTKKVPLKFTYTGTPAESYEVKEISWKPENVEIAGTEEVLAEISQIEIPAEAVNINGIQEELQLVVDLTQYLPYGVNLKEESETSALVTIELEKTELDDESKTNSEN